MATASTPRPISRDAAHRPAPTLAHNPPTAPAMAQAATADSATKPKLTRRAAPKRRHETPTEKHDAPEHVRAREWRIARGQTQAQLGDAIGMSRRTIAKIEAGHADPAAMLTFRMACTALHLGASFDFVTGRFEHLPGVVIEIRNR